jgi:hypothetical protein
VTLGFIPIPEGPYTKLGPPGVPIFKHHCEDPFVYKGRSGYHVICHDMEHGASGETAGCRFQVAPAGGGKVMSTLPCISLSRVKERGLWSKLRARGNDATPARATSTRSGVLLSKTKIIT